MADMVTRRDMPVSLPAMLQESWLRCSRKRGLASRRSGLGERLCSAELQQARDQMGAVMRSACVELDRLASLVLPLGYIALLSDSRGIVVAHRNNEEGDNRTKRWNLRSGALWSEDEVGTNGLGTCLVEGKPVTISGGEHWCFELHRLTCTAMPFFDSDGRVAGALNVSAAGTNPKISGIMEALLFSAARSIEYTLFHRRFGMWRILSLDESKGLSQPLVALDEAGRILGATRAVRDRLRLEDQAFESEELSWPALSGRDDRTRPDFRRAEVHTIEEALALSQGKIAPAARLLGISRSTLHRKVRGLGIERS